MQQPKNFLFVVMMLPCILWLVNRGWQDYRLSAITSLPLTELSTADLVVSANKRWACQRYLKCNVNIARFCLQVLQQRHAKVEAERDQLYSKFEASIYSVQQKTGVRNLLLQKKLSALGGVLEHKEAQLAEVMAASNLDPATLAQLNTVSCLLV